MVKGSRASPDSLMVEGIAGMGDCEVNPSSLPMLSFDLWSELQIGVVLSGCHLSEIALLQFGFVTLLLLWFFWSWSTWDSGSAFHVLLESRETHSGGVAVRDLKLAGH
jgi:hypothetical protein